MFAFEFQSAPLTEARGDPLASVPVARRIKVSIRSPYRSKGRPTAENLPDHPIHSFNPLPLPKQGETQVAESEQHQIRVSIRSPYRSKGRLGHPG